MSLLIKCDVCREHYEEDFMIDERCMYCFGKHIRFKEKMQELRRHKNEKIQMCLLPPEMGGNVPIGTKAYDKTSPQENPKLVKL